MPKSPAQHQMNVVNVPVKIRINTVNFLLKRGSETNLEEPLVTMLSLKALGARVERQPENEGINIVMQIKFFLKRNPEGLQSYTNLGLR